MKKLILTLAIACVALGASAQHKFFLGFEGGFNSTTSKSTVSGTGITTTTTDGPKISGGSFMPYLGYSVTDKIAVGLGLGVIGNKEVEKDVTGTVTTTTTHKENMFTVSPFVRYTTKINDNFHMWGQLNVAPGFGKHKHTVENGTTTTSSENKLSGFEVAVRPGFNYVLGERWIFTGSYGSLGYSTSKETNEANNVKVENKENNFGLNLNWNTLRVGFNFLF